MTPILIQMMNGFERFQINDQRLMISRLLLIVIVMRVMAIAMSMCATWPIRYDGWWVMVHEPRMMEDVWRNWGHVVGPF